MKLATLKTGGGEKAGIAAPHGVVLMETINREERTDWPVDLFALICSGRLAEVRSWYIREGAGKISGFSAVPYADVQYAPLFRHPHKIWGIGFNYADTEEEWRNADPDVDPVSFMKPDTSLIGPGDPIRLPRQSKRTTAEAELAIVIGKVCRNVPQARALQYVAGFTTSLDMSADDIHRQNPRYLTRAKSFDTFFSFGPELLTPDEIPDLSGLTVHTVLNGEIRHRNSVRFMRYSPAYTVAFHSAVMTLLPGDVIMTGTPGPVVIRDGDVVECRIDGFAPLVNPVVRDTADVPEPETFRTADNVVKADEKMPF